MTPKREQQFQKSYAKELLRIAFQDLESAEILAKYQSNRTENVFLLAQQALEKALKAAICWNGIAVPFTHDIAVLIERLGRQVNVPFEGKFDGLSEFATIRRYLEGREEISFDEVQEILLELRSAIDWCDELINN